MKYLFTWTEEVTHVEKVEFGGIEAVREDGESATVRTASFFEDRIQLKYANDPKWASADRTEVTLGRRVKGHTAQLLCDFCGDIVCVQTPGSEVNYCCRKWRQAQDRNNSFVG